MREHYRRGRRRIGSCRIFFLAMSARGSCNGGGARMVDAFERFERRIGERRRGTRNPAEQHNAFLICNRNGRFNDLFEPPTRAFALPPTSIAPQPSARRSCRKDLQSGSSGSAQTRPRQRRFLGEANVESGTTQTPYYYTATVPQTAIRKLERTPPSFKRRSRPQRRSRDRVHDLHDPD